MGEFASDSPPQVVGSMDNDEFNQPHDSAARINHEEHLARNANTTPNAHLYHSRTSSRADGSIQSLMHKSRHRRNTSSGQRNTSVKSLDYAPSAAPSNHSSSPPDDFVSFPTIPDPEGDQARTLSKLLSKTLRKVTNNASNLVQNYSSAKSVTSAQFTPSDSSSSENNPIRLPTLQPTAIVAKDSNPASRVSTSNTLHGPPSLINSNYDNGPETHDTHSSIYAPSIIGSQRSSTPADGHASASSTSDLSKAPASIAPETSQTVLASLHHTTTAPSDEPHRVTSDNNTLRLSTMKLPKLHTAAFNRSATSSVINVNALASTDKKNLKPDTLAVPPLSSSSQKDAKSEPRPHQLSQSFIPDKKDSKDSTLQNKISSIFNNLPNDIELSDDSASDMETINDSSASSPSHRNSIHKPHNANSSNNENTSRHSSNDYFVSSHGFSHPSNNPNNVSMYSEPISVPSPIKAERGRRPSGAQHGSSSMSPTLSTFYALRNKDGSRISSGSMRKKPSSNLSAVIFDNAKSILNNNLTGAVVSSASSIVTKKGKKKKKKPKRLSENPLKNGGIPKKYWMNDAFVSDCLNCFRPFSAFRRKHHCRFCGQIFCSDCTLFISYNQHKQERKLHSSNRRVENGQYYSDKLRVCKPCYDDVIVYLSDDSSSKSDESDDSLEIKESTEEEEDPKASIDYNSNTHQTGENSSSRSLSVNSRRDSLSSQVTINGANNAFSKKGKSTPTSPKTSAFNDESTPTPSRTLQPSAYGYTSSSSFANYQFNGVKPNSSIHNESPKYSSKHAPQMAIPTTRTGEAVEIPVANTSYSNTVTNNKTNLAILAVNNSAIQDSMSSSLPANSGAGDIPTISSSFTRPWFKSHGIPKNSANSGFSIDLPKSNSLENFSQIYNTFIGKRAPKFIRLHSNPDKGIMSGKGKRGEYTHSNDDIDDGSETENDEEREDAESENEDEQVMSLYTSLINTDPRPTTLASASASAVPTLNEFPTIGVEKRFPRNVNAPKSNVLFLDDRPKSESKSSERAQASLMRMQSRRKSKSARNISILSHNNNRLQTDTGSSLTAGTSLTSPSPVTTPNSPTPNYSLQSNLSKGLSNDSLGKNIPTLRASNSASHIETSFDSTPNNRRIDPYAPRLSTADITDYVAHGSSTNASSSDLDKIESPTQEEPIFGVDQVDSTILTPSILPMEKQYNDLIDHILIQCLEDCDISENQEQWKTALRRVLSRVCVLKMTDTLDIKQYIKIKKNLGGKIEDTDIVNGLFMTKNIDSKKMPSRIENPRIALLMFPIEYLKSKEQFISLRIVHSQQDVYITNLVSRLISLEPDIVIVGDSVCGLAEKLLEDANITVISNVKPQVIERLSRYIKADIFQSINDLFFKKGVLGRCELFEVKKYLYQDTIKTFTCFTGTDIESGFTITLRGGSHDVLESIKYATETLISAELNAKLEKSLLRDHGVQFIESDFNPVQALSRHLDEISEDQQDIQDEVLIACRNAIETHEIENYIRLFNERKLSISPAVKFSLPTSLLNVVTAYDKFYRFFKVNRTVQSAESLESLDPALLQDIKINIDIEKLPHTETDMLAILKYVSGYNLKAMVQEFQIRIRFWSNCMKYTSYQLYPIFHKKIHFLHSTVSIKHATPCAGPNIIVIDYYTENDKCLGVYLDQIFEESSKACDECGESLLNHYKTYVHGNSKIDLLIEKFDSLAYDQHFKASNQRIMWSSCKECSYSSPIINMNDSTYYLSIGKFFELSFWGSDTVLANGACQHDFFKDHVRYFALNDLVIRLEFSYIDNYEVVVPRKKLEFVPETDIKLKVESFNIIKKKTANFFSSISKRLNRVKVDTFDKAEDGIQKIEELKNKLVGQVQDIEKKTLHIYDSTSPIVHLPLNSILRDLQELGVEWDNDFNEFEKNFLPTENEITRITQFHLRNFLMDKYNSDGQSKEVEMRDISHSRKGSNTQSLDESDHASEDELCKEQGSDDVVMDNQEHNEPQEGQFDQISSDNANPDDVQGVSPAPTQNTNIVQRIHKMQQLLEQERLTGNNVGEENRISRPPIGKRAATQAQRASVSLQHSGSGPLRAFSYSAAVPDHFGHMDDPERRLQHTDAVSGVNEGEEDEDSHDQDQPQKSKVLDLAKYYNEMHLNQISQEFMERRERELSEKRTNAIKALPIVASKPIVQIYNKIEDVVNDDNTDLAMKYHLRPGAQFKTPNDSLRSGRYPPPPPPTQLQQPQSKVSQIHQPQPLSHAASAHLPKRSTTPLRKSSPQSPSIVQQQQQQHSQQHRSQHPQPPTSQATPPAAQPSSTSNKESLKKDLEKEVGKDKLDIPQPEKNSLLKSLTNFWADRSATLWDPLDYPLDSNEHTFADSDVIVREDEPSSLVAFCLSSNDYKQKIKSMAENKTIAGNSTTGGGGVDNAGLNDNSTAANGTSNTNSTTGIGNVGEVGVNGGGGGSSGFASGSNAGTAESGPENSADNDNQDGAQANGNASIKGSKRGGDENIETNELTNKKINNFLKIEKKFKKSHHDHVMNELEQIMTKNKSTHLKYQYLDGNTNLSCKIFYSEQFEAFRKSCGADDSFIQSLSRCVKWNSSGGKSGSNFLKTLDNRYIVKELSKSELESFVSIAPFYFKYISQSMFNTLTTAIAKIFGFYQIHIKNTDSGKTFRMDFLIMENLFYNHKTTRIFDLKGSMRNRHVQQTGKENEVLLDENMIEYIYESPVFVKEQSKKLLRGSLFNDTSFLSAMDVMDYSLVIGIDDASKKLYIGIIDWLRTFTWDKKVENWVKGNSLVGGGKKGKDPTIVTPKQYRIRFREAMERYILEVPDVWYEGNQ